MKTATFVLSLFSCAFSAFAQVSISGVVVDEAGVPVAGTKVDYNNSPVTVRDRVGHTKIVGPVVNSTVTTAKDGTFGVTGIPAGVYWLCAEPLRPSQIRSCDWGYGGTKLDLSTETSAANVKLQLHAGVTLTFEVSDTGNKIQDYPASVLQAGAARGNFRILVADGMWIKPARPGPASGGVRQYTVLVPAVRSLKMLVDTKLKFVNQVQGGQQQAGGSSSPTSSDTINVNGQPLTYRLSVQ